MEEQNKIHNEEQIEKNSNKENNEKKGRGLFYFVVAFAIIIISIVGATYAYFTATAQTGPENSVTAGSTSVTLGLQLVLMIQEQKYVVHFLLQ